MRTQQPAAWLMRIALPVLAATVVAGQQQPPPKPPVPTAQQPTFRGGVNAVERVVRVRDSKGQFVSGLTANDFLVYEDGVPQKIVNFTTVIGGREMGTLETRPERNVNGVITPRSKPSADMSGRIFIVFIDDLNFEPKNSIMVRQIMAKLKKIIHDEDLVGIVSSGYSSIATDLRHDIGYKHLEDALNKTMGSGMDAKQIIAAPMTADGPAGLRYMAHTAFRTASEILEKMASIPGRRKSFLYISEGYDFDPYKDSRLQHERELYGTPSASNSAAQDQVSPFQRTGNQFSEADLVSDVAELIRMANRANVALYTIDPRGLVAGPDINQNVSMTEFREHQLTQVSSLKALADNTGGFCICDTNDFDGKLALIDAETSDYYVIGYNSSNLDPLKLRRFVKIEVKKPGLDLKYETDYTLKKPSGKLGK